MNIMYSFEHKNLKKMNFDIPLITLDLSSSDNKFYSQNICGIFTLIFLCYYCLYMYFSSMPKSRVA